MKYVSFMLVVLLAGCGGGDTQYFAAFLTTDTAAALALLKNRQSEQEQEQEPVTAAAVTRGTAPAADAFQAKVRAVVATPSEGAEPEVVSGVPASAPENSEPAPL